MSKIDYDLLKPFFDVMRWLEAASPVETRNMIENRLIDALVAKRDEVVLGWRLYPVTQLQEANIVVGRGQNPLVTPAGARLLLELYQRNYLPKREGRRQYDGVWVNPDIYEYIQSEGRLIALSAERREKVRLSEEELNEMVENLAEVPESRFSYSLLKTLFDRRMGQYSGSMTIGGIQVTKSIDSNSASDRTERFSWRSRNGQRQMLDSRLRSDSRQLMQ